MVFLVNCGVIFLKEQPSFGSRVWEGSETVLQVGVGNEVALILLHCLQQTRVQGSRGERCSVPGWTRERNTLQSEEQS